MTQAVILAGGKGARLAALLNGKPKCLIDIEGIPLLQRQLELLKFHGVSNVIVLVNHAADQVVSFLKDHDSFGIQVDLIDDGIARGTSGAVLAALDRLWDRFIVVYGDVLLNVDLSRFIATHDDSAADATLFLHPNDHPADSDLVSLDEEGWIKAFHSYPHEEGRSYANLVNAALYVIEKRSLEKWRDFPSPSDFGKDLFSKMLETGSRLKGYRSFEYIKDVGTPARLAKAAKHLRAGVVQRASLAERQKAVFIDRDGTLNFHRGFVRSADAFELMPGVADAVRRLNDSEYRAVLVTNQPVIARGECTLDELGGIHAKLETKLGESGAFLDAIYFCPHHPDKGFAGEVVELKTACRCRKPNTGMIERAIADLNIDVASSWLIGDATGDIETARRAHLMSVLVRTGEGGKDGKFDAEPSHVAEDFVAAVDLILSQRGGK
jgi:D,D-heptose 1,7-bisphosphate phosphatase